MHDNRVSSVSASPTQLLRFVELQDLATHVSTTVTRKCHPLLYAHGARPRESLQYSAEVRGSL